MSYSKEFADLLFQEVLGMEDATTYQAIVRKTRLAEARQILLDLGQQRFGPGDNATLRTLNAIEDVQMLEEMIKRLLKAESWQELIQPRKRRRGNGRSRSNG